MSKYLPKIDRITEEVLKELEMACEHFKSFRNSHEGYAVILEELDELWDAIKDKKCSLEDQRKEAIQVAAMAMRFIFDLCK